MYFCKYDKQGGPKRAMSLTKTPEEAYWIALSYDSGDKYARTYVATTGGTGGSSAPMAGGLQIKPEPVGVIQLGS